MNLFSNLTPEIQHTNLTKLATMLMRKLFFVLALTLTFGQILQAQVRTITGKIISSTDNKPISGATVTIKGDKRTASVGAGENGSFTIQAPPGHFVLAVTAIGYEPRELSSASIAGETFVIALKESAKGLNEVVVVGYGTTKKKDLTGSVGLVQMGNTEQTPITGTSQMLEGTVAGVQVTQTNAQPGPSFTVRVRGTNSISYGSDPLYVVDGYPGADITLNPNDIESITVLKDASATAIYGSRGANGVVMITTKKGISGKSTVSFDMYTGIQQVSRELEMMNATQFATYLDSVTAIANRAGAPASAKTLPYTSAQTASLGAGTNWQKALFRTAPISNYSLSFSGGNPDSRHYLSRGSSSIRTIIGESSDTMWTIR
jgi:TonB-dependent SusC/RagA subfamily outer membrane receptor